MDYIIKSDSSRVKKEECVTQLGEIKKIKGCLAAIIKEYVTRLDTEQWETSPLGNCFEIYTSLNSLEVLLGKWLVENKEKPEIKITDQQKLIYSTLFMGFESLKLELRKLYRIFLSSENNYIS